MKNKSACDSIVMTWVDDGHVRSPYIGRLKKLILHTPPWAIGTTLTEQDAQAEQIAVVDWYEAKYLNTALYNSPVVSRSFKAQPDGEFCFCKDLEPVALSLLPYIGNEVPASQHWQVLSILRRDVAVFKPDLEKDSVLPDVDA